MSPFIYLFLFLFQPSSTNAATHAAQPDKGKKKRFDSLIDLI
jgi:hypothetical protein